MECQKAMHLYYGVWKYMKPFMIIDHFGPFNFTIYLYKQ